MFEYGYGVTKDISTAIECYEVAAVNNHEEAKKSLRRLINKKIMPKKNINVVFVCIYFTMTRNNFYYSTRTRRRK
jgi:TPR repeat protein